LINVNRYLGNPSKDEIKAYTPSAVVGIGDLRAYQLSFTGECVYEFGKDTLSATFFCSKVN
jgi:hypothetical protein